MKAARLAELECPNHDPHGNCLLIERASLYDYRVPLEPWISPAEWEALVTQARAEGRDRVDVFRPCSPFYHARPGEKPRLLTHRRHHLYYCPGCGVPMAGRGDMCPGCRGQPSLPDDLVDRRCLVARDKRCGYFERVILKTPDQPSPKDQPDLQARRLKARAEYRARFAVPAAVAADGRRCPGCGGPVAFRRRICDSCRRRRRRESNRQTQRRKRLAVGAGVSS